MGKVLVVGAGGVGTVVVHKMASQPDVFSEILLASRTKSKCDALARKIGNNRIQTAKVDADNVPQFGTAVTVVVEVLAIRQAMETASSPIRNLLVALLILFTFWLKLVFTITNSIGQ